MKPRLAWFGLIFALVVCIALRASDVPREFKGKLEARYKHQKVVIIQPRVLAGVVDRDNALSSPFTVNYDHFYASVTMPKGNQKRKNFDERTTEEVQAEAGRADYLEPGEILNVDDLRIGRRFKEYYAVDLDLRSLSGKRLTYGNVQGQLVKKEYGVHFCFVFDPKTIEEGAYKTVVCEIDKYLLPQAEYQQATVSGQK
jgi:hypothetical protein